MRHSIHKKHTRWVQYMCHFIKACDPLLSQLPWWIIRQLGYVSSLTHIVMPIPFKLWICLTTFNSKKYSWNCTADKCYAKVFNYQLNSLITFVFISKNLPKRDTEVERSANAPQFDSSKCPRMLTKELPLFNNAAFSGATWLYWTDEKQPMKPLEPAWATSSSKTSLPVWKKKSMHVKDCLLSNILTVIYSSKTLCTAIVSIHIKSSNYRQAGTHKVSLVSNPWMFQTQAQSCSFTINTCASWLLDTLRDWKNIKGFKQSAFIVESPLSNVRKGEILDPSSIMTGSEKSWCYVAGKLQEQNNIKMSMNVDILNPYYR